PIDVLTLIKDISNLKQLTTQSGGLRPFGVSLMLVGVDKDNGPVLYVTEPSGIYFQYKATVIGEGELEIDDVLRREYGPDITIDQALKLAINGLKKFLGKEFSIDRIEAGYIKNEEKVFKKIEADQLKRVK
ncbi:proteasome subunit alpha, partial [Candidatus Woesearchaeota archaeon]|nr:proteasome subunit alpha [Candidatus Woesearchaeota archaeon]